MCNVYFEKFEGYLFSMLSEIICAILFCDYDLCLKKLLHWFSQIFSYRVHMCSVSPYQNMAFDCVEINFL